MMNKRSIILVIDGFGIGAMHDANLYKESDVNASTIKSILTQINWEEIPNLKKLGLKNLIENQNNKSEAFYTKASLGYTGADSYFGHQEINGSIVPEAKKKPLKEYINLIEEKLEVEKYKVKRFKFKNNEVLIVNDSVLIADNMETDLGQVININACFDTITYEEELKIGLLVREIVEVTRVIVLGSHNIKIKNFTDNLIEKDVFIGINTPKSGVYNDTYMCKHLGLKIDNSVQLPVILHNNNIKSYLVAKYGDLIYNPISTNSFNIAETNEIFFKSLELLKNTEQEKCFIGINIQETDLSGHSMDLTRYVKVIKETDKFIGLILSKLRDGDLFIICADHGNDPLIGHTHHTREHVPFIMYNKRNYESGKIAELKNLNSIGKTAGAWLGVKLPNGKNVLENLKGVIWK